MWRVFTPFFIIIFFLFVGVVAGFVCLLLLFFGFFSYCNSEPVYNRSERQVKKERRRDGEKEGGSGRGKSEKRDIGEREKEREKTWGVT